MHTYHILQRKHSGIPSNVLLRYEPRSKESVGVKDENEEEKKKPTNNNLQSNGRQVLHPF